MRLTRLRLPSSFDPSMSGTLGACLRSRYVAMCLSCLATLACANWLAEWTGYRFWQPTINSNADRLFAFARHVEQVDVVFLGSSRVTQGVHAPEMQVVLSAARGEPVSAYSLGVPNGCMLEYASFAENLLVGEKKPKLVVVSVSVQDLYVNPVATVTHFRYYATQADILRLLPSVRTEREVEAALYGLCRGLSSFQLAVAESPFLPRFDARVQTALAQRGSWWRDTETAYGARFSDRKNPARVVENAIRWQSLQVEGAHFDGPGVQALHRLIADTRARGIQLLLVENPLLPEYYEAWAATPAYGAYKAVLREITARERIPLFDATAAELGLTARDFHDPDHMHPEGAKKFTRILGTTAILPLLAPGP